MSEQVKSLNEKCKKKLSKKGEQIRQDIQSYYLAKQSGDLTSFVYQVKNPKQLELRKQLASVKQTPLVKQIPPKQKSVVSSAKTPLFMPRTSSPKQTPMVSSRTPLSMPRVLRPKQTSSTKKTPIVSSARTPYSLPRISSTKKTPIVSSARTPISVPRALRPIQKPIVSPARTPLSVPRALRPIQIPKVSPLRTPFVRPVVIPQEKKVEKKIEEIPKEQKVVEKIEQIPITTKEKVRYVETVKPIPEYHESTFIEEVQPIPEYHEYVELVQPIPEYHFEEVRPVLVKNRIPYPVFTPVERPEASQENFFVIDNKQVPRVVDTSYNYKDEGEVTVISPTSRLIIKSRQNQPQSVSTVSIIPLYANVPSQIQELFISTPEMTRLKKLLSRCNS